MTRPPQRPGPRDDRGRPRRPDPQRPGRPARPEPPTQRIRRPPPAEPPTQQLGAQRADPTPATERLARPDTTAAAQRQRRFPRDRKSLGLIAVGAVALLVAGLLGAELFARHRADTVLRSVAQCVTEDGASVSYGVDPPFLWQYLTGHYTNIDVSTDGNRVQEAEGMKADITVTDVRLDETADSKGTIGRLTATLTWTADGIKDTVAANLPVIGNLVSDVRTDAAAGTIALTAGSIVVTAKPVVTDGDLGLQVTDLQGPLDRDTVQQALDDLTAKLNDNYPLGIHADSVQVTGTGVVGAFSTTDAAIPTAGADPCFADL
ncbi:DUF2993 domain-containing protein [Mycobacterium sp. MYCO198283]|uniref:LmeA family phospholipid-binding protein n=1 Tax=Mycobacterium sp. MYCO198283 TaxID=2883505 RepID=UPI001E59F6B2|nr:DUF2993 domain-containing protein [Mycobacterium sp. MYCO198283]MCG5432403.1 DUF2993 domain-containing protein [Mycobacterium sp. MYCO198283]